MQRPVLIIGNKNYSSWSLRAWLAARKSGMDFTEVRIALGTPASERNLAEYSPTHKVPVLRVGELVLWDSLAICEFVNERYANGSLWPSSSETRAQSRAVVAEMHSGFETLRGRCPMNIRARNRRVEHSQALARDIARILAIWRNLRAQYGDSGPWLFGRFSIADAFFAPVVFRFLTYGIALDSAARAYAECVTSDTDVQAWVEAARAETEVVSASEVGAGT